MPTVKITIVERLVLDDAEYDVYTKNDGILLRDFMANRYLRNLRFPVKLDARAFLGKSNIKPIVTIDEEEAVELLKQM